VKVVAHTSLNDPGITEATESVFIPLVKSTSMSSCSPSLLSAMPPCTRSSRKSVSTASATRFRRLVAKTISVGTAKGYVEVKFSKGPPGRAEAKSSECPPVCVRAKLSKDPPVCAEEKLSEGPSRRPGEDCVIIFHCTSRFCCSTLDRRKLMSW
jgi:hypothetical protein